MKTESFWRQTEELKKERRDVEEFVVFLRCVSDGGWSTSLLAAEEIEVAAMFSVCRVFSISFVRQKLLERRGKTLRGGKLKLESE